MGIPDVGLFHVEIEWDHLSVRAPKLVENALHNRRFAAFPAGEDNPELGQPPWNIVDPLGEILKFFFTADKQLGTSVFFFQRIFHYAGPR